MTFKSDRLLSFFAFLVIQTSIKAQTICVEGCLICNNSDKFNTCTQCLEGYVLDSKNNLCVYAECSDNLFYDKNQQEAKSLQSGCVAVCSAFSYQNQMSNICQSKLKCSFQKSTQQQLIDITQAKDVFVYQQNYYVIQKERSLSFYDKNQLNLIKYVSLQAKDLTVLQVNGVIFLVEVDNSISVLDIENESKNEIMSPKIIPFNLLTQITSINNRYVLAFNINYEKQSVFQILFDLSYQQFSLSNSSTLDDINQSFKIVDKWLFIQNQNIIIVKKISIINSNDILNLQIQNHFRIELEKNSEYFNILPSSQLGIYILVQDLSAYQINLVSNSYKSIEIQLNERYNIKKSKIFQIYDTDLNEQLILLTELQLIYTNLLTNQSNYIKLDLGSIKDLEIYNIWAKEKLIVLLDSYNQLQLFYFDSSSQQFVLYNKQFNLYQGTDLFLIRYQNQSSTQKEFIYELASKSDNYVQIIKNQGGALGQQKQLIKKNAITNFNLQFPITQLEKNTKLLTLYKYYMTDYYPPLIHINKGRNQIFSYDCSVETTYQIAILDESRIFKVYNFGLTLLSIYQVNSQGFLSYYVQNQKNTNIIFIMHNGQNALTTFYPSYVIIQKNRKLMSDKFLKKAIFGKQQSQLYILLTQSVMSVDIYTGFQETLFSFANPIDYQVIKFFSDFKQLFVYDKIQNTTKTIQIDNANLTYQVFDELYENIFIYENDKDKLNSIRIYSSNGDLKQIIQKNVSDCTLFKVKLACKLQKGLILIDRENLAFNELFTEDEDYANIRKFIYIGHLNFLLLQLDNNLSQILIYDIFAEQVIYKIQVNLSQLKNNNITYFQFDESQSSYVMLFDSEGKLYLSSIDQNKPYQSFINICNSCDQTLFEFISHDSLSNEIYLRINDSIYQLDYELLGIKREPMLNEPFNFFTLIQISGVLTDYLILNQDNVVFRYSQNKLKSELSVIQSNIQSIRYNQESDVLILALEYSILLYKQFQFNTNNKMDHDIYVLDEIQFQNFITDSVIITFDQKILHVNVASGAIINIIQFNITQIVTSFNINHNQDLIIIGFSDGQILQYNLAEQAVFIYDTALQNPINISIFTIQLIEISVTNTRAQKQCVEGCSICNNINNQSICSKCQDDYELDQKNNLCVYTKCSSNLFYEKNQSDNSILGGGCVAICSAYSYKNYQNNICQSQQKCSIQRKTYQQMNDNTVTRDFFLYKDDYYVIQKEDQISIYNRNNLKNLKNMKLEASDLQVFNVNNSIFIIGSDSSITLLDIINGSRIPKSFANMISVNTFSQIDLIDNRYVMIKNFQTETGLEFQIFYDQTSQIFSLSNSIKINFIQKKIKFIDQWLFIQSSNSIVVYKIIISKNNLNLNIQVQNHFIFQAQQNSDYLDIISSQQLGIYILVKQASAYFVDLNNNSFKSIQIDLKDKEQILKSKIFQASQSDLLVEYLIIRTNEQLIFTNLQTNSSNQIKLFNTPYFDFDISNLWGNEKQIVVLYEKVNLSFYQLDSNLQKFIELKQKYVFNYKTNNRLYQIKYENKNLSQKEDIYELVTRDDSYIQIIKKESNPSLQEKQLIQINVITDYVLPFPTASQVQSQNFNFSELPNFIVISYIPPLVIFLNDNQEVNFYDYSDVTNLQFQKQLKISSNLLTLQKFSNNKIIALEPTMGYIIDIYTKNVVNIFYTDHCQYSSNSDYLATIYQNCLIIQSLEMKILFNNCKTEFKDLNFNLYLNYDLKIMTQEKSGQYISVYQIDLQSQSLQYLNTITNVKLFQIVKSFTSFEDEINNKFSIDQIVIIDQNDTFQIYDFSLSLIFQMNSLKVSQIKSVNQVVNDNQVYIVSGYEGILLINISFNTQKLIKSDLKLYGHKFYSTTIAEYTIDNDQNKVFEAALDQKNGKLYLYSYVDISIILLDIYTGYSKTLYTFQNQIRYLEIKLYEEFLLASDDNNIFLINIQKTENYVKKNFKVNNIDYVKEENVIYANTLSTIFILDTKLNVIQEFFNYTQDLTCILFKRQIVCYSVLPQDQFSFFLIIDKASKNYLQISNEIDYSEYLFDYEYENIFVFPINISILKIYSPDGSLKQILEKIKSVCRIFTSNILCESEKSLLLIDRVDFRIKSKIKNVSFNLFKEIEYIESLNYLIFQPKYILSQITVYDISTKTEINQIRIQKQEQIKDNRILQFKVDFILNLVMFIDLSGTFYLSSIDPQFPFYSYFKIYEPYPSLQPSQFKFDILSNNIYFIYQANVYVLDYYLLGQQNEPQLNEPYNLFTQIYINSLQIDYLILSQGSLLFRYSQQKLSFELSIIKSRMLDVKYNQKSDVLILGLVDSILFYQQYQSSKNKNFDPIIYQLDMIQFQQFILDSVVITYDHQILHLNILTGAIINKIQFNVTQIVTSFNINKSQDLIIIGFSDGQLLQYNLQSQTHFLYDTTQKGPLNTSIFFIQIIEISNVSLVKKNLLKDTIIDFKLFVNNTVALLLIDRFELFVIEGDKFKMIAQISYQYPRIMSYSFDSNKNMLHILGLHKAGVFQNSYNLDIHRSDTLSECSFFYSVQEQQNIIEEQAFATVKKNEIQTLNGISLTNQDNYYIYNYIQVPPIDIQNTFLQISQQKNSLFVIAPYDVQNNLLALSNNTFQNISLTNLQLTNFILTFQDKQNLFINITQNKQIQQVTFQNMAIEFSCFGNNQIYLSDIEKVVFQNIKITQLNLKECSLQNQQKSLFNFYNISEIYIYNLEISNNNFYQKSQIPIFQFEMIKTIIINGIKVMYNTNLNSLMNFQQIQNLKLDNIGSNGAQNLGSALAKCTNVSELTLNIE
ncbi:hypothetical protein ABPG74_018585 [Tetrahymena malaccensis]